MTLEYILAMVGPGLLGGALAYFVWAKIEARGQKAAKPSARKTPTPPITGSTEQPEEVEMMVQELPTDSPPQALVLEQTDVVAERPAGAEVDALERTSSQQQDTGALEALRADVAELASSLLSVHETMTQNAAQDAEKSTGLSDITARLDELTSQVAEGQSPDRLAAALAAKLPKPATAELPDAIATLPARMDQLANALTSALGNLPEDIRSATAQNATPATDLSGVEARLEELAERMTQPDDAGADALGADIAKIRAQLESADLELSLTALREDLSALSEDNTPKDPSPSPERFDALEQKINALAPADTSQADERLDARLAQMEERLAELAKPDDITARLAQLEDRTSSALISLGKAMQGAFSARTAEPDAALQDRMDSMASAVTGIGGKLSAVEGLDMRLAGLEATLKEEIRDAALFARGAAGEALVAASVDNGTALSEGLPKTLVIDTKDDFGPVSEDAAATDAVAKLETPEGTKPDPASAERTTGDELEAGQADPFDDILTALAQP